MATTGLNVVDVRDVARGHALAHERGAARRALSSRRCEPRARRPLRRRRRPRRTGRAPAFAFPTWRPSRRPGWGWRTETRCASPACRCIFPRRRRRIRSATGQARSPRRSPGQSGSWRSTERKGHEVSAAEHRPDRALRRVAEGRRAVSARADARADARLQHRLYRLREDPGVRVEQGASDRGGVPRLRRSSARRRSSRSAAGSPSSSRGSRTSSTAFSR